MTSPADTIREARVIRILIDIVRGRKTDGFNLFTISGDELNALAAALTELEQQLDGIREERWALYGRVEAAEADRDRLAAELRYIHARVRSAGAALDRHTTPTPTEKERANPHHTGAPGDIT